MLLFLPILHLIFRETDAAKDEEKLLQHLFHSYNHLIQPVRSMNETPMIVKVALQLVLLINVDEKDQVMHTNVWLTLVSYFGYGANMFQQWTDFQMRWDPRDYGYISTIRVAADRVWRPDIVLFNNADGNYEVAFSPNVVIENDGTMLWVPPAIYKSSCIIDVEYFPFDEQTCYLIFGSWTYNANEIKLDFLSNEMIDLEEYDKSSIWDVVDAPAILVNHRSRIEFQLKIRRKTLFYTMVLIIPTMIMAFLSIAVFFLPTDCTEKITLTISVLLSIVVFLLLVSKILPPTSSTIPLMAKYLLLTFVLNVITIMTTILIINIYWRSPLTHTMPDWARFLFLKAIPWLICVSRPPKSRRTAMHEIRRRSLTGSAHLISGIGEFRVRTLAHHPHCPSSEDNLEDMSPLEDYLEGSSSFRLPPEAFKALESIDYITEHLREHEEQKASREDWKYAGMVLDRLLLYVFFGITAGGTVGILASSPHVFDEIDQQAVLEKLIANYKNIAGGTP